MNAATDRKSQLDLLAVSLLVLCCGFWGYQQILIKTTIAEVPPLWQASIRFLGSAALLIVWCVWRRIPLLEKDGSLLPGLVSGLFFALELATLYWGIQFTSASRQMVLLYIAPFVLAALLPQFVPSERLQHLQWAGLFIAFSSVVLAIGGEWLSSPQLSTQLLGDSVSIMAGVLWALALLSIRISCLARIRAEKIMLYQVLVPALVLPVLSALQGEAWTLAYSGPAWLSLGLQTTLGGFATFLIWMWILRHYPVTLVSSFAFLTPVCALLFGVLLGEPITFTLVLALLGVILGMLILNRMLPLTRP